MNDITNLIQPPPGFMDEDEVEEYHPVGLVTAYRPGGGWDMGLDPEVEGPDRDAYDNPIQGRSTMEDYLDGNADYVTVAMDKASSWQGGYLESPNFPGVPFKVADHGDFGDNKAGNDWVDIAYRDPEKARGWSEQGVPFKPITEEQAKEMRTSRPEPPEGFVDEEEVAGKGPQPTGGLTIENGIDPDAPYMSKPRENDPTRIIMHGDVNEDADQLVEYGRKVDPNRGFAPGYHFYVARDGRVIQGAPVDRITNHTLGANSDSIGINIAGADEGKMPTPEQDAAAKKLISQLGQQYGIDPTNVIGHGELQPNRRNKLEGGNIARDIRENGFIQASARVEPPPGFMDEGEVGNIDVSKRGPVPTGGGQVATVRSIGIEENGEHIVIPTVVGNKIVSDDEAVQHYHETGEYLGKFKDQASADTFAQTLHESEEKRVGKAQAGMTGPRKTLYSAIQKIEADGYDVPHFIGRPDEPEGDRAPTMDMENLVSSLKRQEQDAKAQGNEAKATMVRDERTYWEKQIKEKGMSAEQWKKQTGEEDPTLGPVAKQGYLPIKKAIQASPHAPTVLSSISETANDIWNAVKRGYIQGEIAVEMQKPKPDFDYVTDKMKEAAAIPASDNYQLTWNDKVSTKASIQAFLRNPIGVIGELIGESIGTQLKTMPEELHRIPERMAQFTAAGAAGGTLAAGPAGGVAGGLGGASVGFATGLAEAGAHGSIAAEYSSSILSSMEEAGIDTKDPKALEKAFSDPKKMAEWRDKAMKKAVPIGILDGLSFAMGGKLFAQPAKKIGGKVAQWGVELGAQAALGGGGEALGQLWSEGEITSVRSVIAEIAGEVPGGVAEVGIGRVQKAFQNRGLDEKVAKDLALRVVAAAREAQAAAKTPPVEVPGAPPAPAPSAAAPEGTAKPTAPEYIRSAAIRADDGAVFEGSWHGEARQEARDAGYDIPLEGSEKNIGFITSKGRFVSPEEALGIARKVKQVTEEGGYGSGLVAEDLKPDFEPPPPAEPAPEFGPVAGPVRSSLEKNLPAEDKGEATNLTNAATSYMGDYDAAAAELEGDPQQSLKAHEAAMKNVPTGFKDAFRMLPANAMDADPATFGEWLAESYSGTRPAAPEGPKKSVAEMIREAKVRVETAESQAAVEEMAAPAAPAEVGPSSEADAEALVAKYREVDEVAVAQRKPTGTAIDQKSRSRILRIVAADRTFQTMPANEQKVVVENISAVADMVGQQFSKFGIKVEVEPNKVHAAGVAYDKQGNLSFYISPKELYQTELETTGEGAPIGLISRISNGEELIHAADLSAQVQEWKKNPVGRNFWEYRRDETAKLFKDVRKKFNSTKDKKTRDRLYQSLLDTYNLYYIPSDQKRPTTYKTGEDLLDAMDTLAASNIERLYARPVGWMAEFVRQAHQLEKQGEITEGVFNEFLRGVKNWLHRALRRVQRMLPGVQQGAYGKVMQDRVQRIKDILEGKDVAEELYAPREVPSDEEQMISERKAKENGPFPLNAKNPKTIINIGMHIEGDGDLTENQVWDALNKHGVKVKASDVKTSTYVNPKGETVTENYFAAELENAMDDDTAYSVSVDTKQDVIAQRTGADGNVFGPNTGEWTFNSDYFDNEVLFRMSAEKLAEIAKDNEEFKDWYDRLDAAFEDILKGYEEYIPLIKEILAATSQINLVKGNVTEMARVLEQYIRDGTIRGMLRDKRANMERLLRGEKISGPKVGPFSAAMHGIVDATAIDRHVGMMLFGTKAPSAKQHIIGHERIAQVAARLGWTNRQLQAALFAADIRSQGKTVERYEDAIRARQEEIRGSLSRDITGRGREASRRIAERVREGGGIAQGGEQVVVERRARGNVPTGTQAVSPQGTTQGAAAGFGANIGRNDIERLWFGTSQIFDKVPGLKPLADAIRAHVDKGRELLGRFGAPYRKWRNAAGAGARSAAIADADKHWNAIVAGKPADAAAIRAKASPAAKSLIETDERVLNDMWDMAEKEQYKIKDPVTGQYKPFKRGPDLFPRIINPKILDTFRNTDGNDKAWKDLRSQLINSGDISAANADADLLALRDKVMGLLKSNDMLGNVDLWRNTKLPLSFFDTSHAALMRFVVNFSEAMARKIALGQKTGGQGTDIFDYFHDKVAGNDATRDYIRYVQSVAYNEQPNSVFGKLSAVGSQIASPTMLANPKSVEKNWVTGMAFTIQHYGPMRTLQAMRDVFGSIQDAYERGIIKDDIMNIIPDGERLVGERPRLLPRITRRAFQAVGWDRVEVHVRGISYQAAKGWLRWAIKENLKNPESKNSLINRGRIQRLGINPNSLFAEGAAGGPLTDRFFRSAVAEIQGGYEYDQTPGFASAPEGKIWTQFRKFSTQALMHFDREVLRPFARAVSSGRWAEEWVNVPDPVTGKNKRMRVPGEAMPLVGFLIVMAMAGEAEDWIAQHLFGTPSRHASYAEIMSRLNRDKVGGVRLIFGRILGDMLNIGMLGLLGDFLQMGVDYAAGRQPRSLMDIPALQGAEETLNLAKELIETKGEFAPRALDRFFKNTFSIYRVGGQMAAQGFKAFGIKHPYTQTISRKQDVARVRNFVRRYNDEMKYQRKPGMPPGRMSTSPETAFREQLKDFLLIGDTKAAKKLVDDHFKGMSGERLKDAMDKLEQSVRGSQPIKAGAGGGEPARILFLEWARTALDPAELATVLDVDKTYRESARSLGLMDLKEPKPRAIQEARRKRDLLSEDEEE